MKPGYMRSVWACSAGTVSTGGVVPELLVGLERLGRTSIGDEGPDQEMAQPLAQGMSSRQLPQLGDEVGALVQGLEVGLQAILGRGQPELVEPDGGGRCKGNLRGAGQRLAPPERERLAQLTCRHSRLAAAQRKPPSARKALEPEGVHHVGRQVEEIAPGTRPHRLTSGQGTAEA